MTLFYVAHRLFGLHDRMLGAIVAERLALAVGTDAVFLPFCDTDEETLEATVKGRVLFDLDSARLQTLRGMIAILHGPSLDDGVCLEIGFARRLGVPVVVLTTDFQTYGLPGDDNHFHFSDPLVQTVCSEVVRVSAMAPEVSDGSRAGQTTRYAAYGQRNTKPLHDAADRAVLALLRHVGRQATAPNPRTLTAQVMWEQSPYHRNRGDQPEAIGKVVRSTRLDTARRGPAAAVLCAAVSDWVETQRSSILLVDLDGPETPAGAALMIGCARAQGSQVWGRYTSPFVTYAPGREANRRNLMVHYSIDRWLER